MLISLQNTNFLHGQIPPMSGMPNLVSFMAGHNGLSGTIPGDWASSVHLSIFSVEFNALQGSIPPIRRRSVAEACGMSCLDVVWL